MAQFDPVSIRPWLVSIALLAVLSACVSPSVHMHQLAHELGLIRESVQGHPFQHIVYLNQAAKNLSQIKPPELHIYLEGDGDPWLNHHTIAADPTPRDPLALRLLARDPAAAVYLGRPCYHGLAQIPPCSPEFWTSRRYSETVVTSMAFALRQLPEYQAAAKIVLIGHSGGGTLAMLLAARLAKTRAVMTLAGNLDPQAWAALHRYSELTDSLNPALQPALPASIQQIHLMGRQDRNIPPHLAPLTILQQSNVRTVKIEAYNHTCCWLEDWHSLLSYLDSTD